MKRLLFPLLLALLPVAVHAARPMVTDDARLTDAGACQLESWVHAHAGEHEWWALPACNPGGNLEFTVGGARAWSDGRTDGVGRVVQLKTLLRPLQSNDFGVGFAAGYATQPGRGERGDPYFYVPASWSLNDDAVVLHLNLGKVRERENSSTRTTWGLGSEIEMTPTLYGIVESYGQDRGAAWFQGGLRYWIVPGHVQIDTTVGSRAGDWRGERWFSLGLRLISPRLF